MESPTWTGAKEHERLDLQAEYARQLYEGKAQEIAAKYGLARDELDDIYTEGESKIWDKPKLPLWTPPTEE